MRPVLYRLPEWLGGIEIPSYGLMMVLGPLASALAFAWLGRRRGLSPGQAFEAVLETALVGIVVGKLSGVLLLPPGTDLTWRVVAGSGGIWYFGFIGGFAWFCFRTARLGMKTLDALDHLLPTVALGHAFGRVGCFLAGCCWGAPCDAPWAVTFPAEAGRHTGVPVNVALHPVQLYEAFAEVALFVALAWYLLRRRRFLGEVTLLYLGLYAIVRFSLEFVRADWRGAIGWLSTSQLVAACILALVLPFLVRGYRRGGLGILAEWPFGVRAPAPDPRA